MKPISIKLITLIGLTSVLLLQFLWLHNIYTLHCRELKEKINFTLLQALQWEIGNHTDSNPMETLHVHIDETNDLPTKHYHVEVSQSFHQEELPLSLERIDSFFHAELEIQQIHSDYYLTRIHTENDEIVESSGKKPATRWGILESEPIAIANRSEILKVALTSPYRMIFGKMIFLFFATVIILGLVVYCIIYQIRIIARQDRIARIREDFSHAMIHDMKSPINTILVGLNMLHSEKLLDKPEKRDNYYRIASDECQRLLALADKVLTLARLEQDSLTLHKQQTLLKPIVSDLAEKFASKAGKPIRFEIKIHSEDIVYADGDYLREAISNLIENAIKYSGESVRIDIKRTVHEEHDHISIRDNGFGIPFKDQKKIFDKFERASAAGRKDRAKGLGLGLNYVNNVIRAHGGQVILRSIEGEYSEFILVLPRQKPL